MFHHTHQRGWLRCQPISIGVITNAKYDIFFCILKPFQYHPGEKQRIPVDLLFPELPDIQSKQNK